MAFSVAQPAQPNLLPIEVPQPKTLAQLMDEQRGLTNQTVKDVNRQTMFDLGSVANLRSVSPETLQNVIGSDSFLSASTGFNNPEDLLGMTPENYQKMVMPNQQNPVQMLQSYQNLADSVTGMPQTKATLSDAVKSNSQNLIRAELDNASAANRGLADQNNLTLNSITAKNKQDLDLFHINNQTWLKGEELKNYNQQHAMDRALRKELARVSQSGNAMAVQALEGLGNGTLHTPQDEAVVTTALKNVKEMPEAQQGALKIRAAKMGLFGTQGVPFDAQEASDAWKGYSTNKFVVKPVPEGKPHLGKPGELKLWRWNANQAGWEPTGNVSKRIDLSVLKAGSGGSSSQPYFMTQGE